MNGITHEIWQRLELHSRVLRRTLILSVSGTEPYVRASMHIQHCRVCSVVIRLDRSGIDIGMTEILGELEPGEVELRIGSCVFALERDESTRVADFFGIPIVTYEDMIRICLA
jgi:hypothetical protein